MCVCCACEADEETVDEVFSGQVERTVVVRRQIVQMTGLYGSPTHAADLGVTSVPPSHGQFYHSYRQVNSALHPSGVA